MEEYCSLAFRFADTITNATIILKSAFHTTDQASIENQKSRSYQDELKETKVRKEEDRNGKGPGDHITMTFKNWTMVDVEIQGEKDIYVAALGPLATHCVNLTSLTISNMKSDWLDILDHFSMCRSLEVSTCLSHDILSFCLCGHFKEHGLH